MLTRSAEIDEYVRQKETTFITPDIIASVEQGKILFKILLDGSGLINRTSAELVQDMHQFLRKKVRDVKEDEWRFNAKFNNSFM